MIYIIKQEGFQLQPRFLSTYGLFVFKMARYSFPRPIPPKLEHKLRRQEQRFGKIATTVVLDKDENLL